jgi:hypothetical protein
MKYAWIKRHRSVWPVSLTCEVLGVSASGYRVHTAGGHVNTTSPGAMPKSRRVADVRPGTAP